MARALPSQGHALCHLLASRLGIYDCRPTRRTTNEKLSAYCCGLFGVCSVAPQICVGSNTLRMVEHCEDLERHLPRWATARVTERPGSMQITLHMQTDPGSPNSTLRLAGRWQWQAEIAAPLVRHLAWKLPAGSESEQEASDRWALSSGCGTETSASSSDGSCSCAYAEPRGGVRRPVHRLSARVPHSWWRADSIGRDVGLAGLPSNRRSTMPSRPGSSIGGLTTLASSS